MKLSISILSLVSIVVWCRVSVAQEPDCGAVAAAGRMARATAVAKINESKQKAGSGYRAQLVLASRVLELRPGDRQAAVQLLNLIPKNDAEQTIWMTLGDALCVGESFGDMRSLADIRDRFPRNLTRAVLLVPEKLPEYVAYGGASTLDPHSDYAVQMRVVCRAQHQAFLKAINSLPPTEKQRFVHYTFDPETCHAIRLPEAD